MIIFCILEFKTGIFNLYNIHYYIELIKDIIKQILEALISLYEEGDTRLLTIYKGAMYY